MTNWRTNPPQRPPPGFSDQTPPWKRAEMLQQLGDNLETNKQKEPIKEANNKEATRNKAQVNPMDTKEDRNLILKAENI